MKYLRQILLVLLLSFLGELLHSLIPMPIPASIYGMVLLFLSLSLKIIRLEQIQDAGKFFVSILPVLFVAPVVSLMDCWEIIRPNLAAIVGIIFVSTVICFGVCGRVTQMMMKHRKKEGKHHA